ncbi:hypothetical protein H4J38_08010 [Colwellia sp. BRX10-3]|uniref:hypothetical protein n=1 Tax=Colwellia sp. BRX10-3 TaxID=2759844 RepID=UPI0015F5683B|nr:hypothetical protein [Colwellia sp. BRX10-3]
MNITKVGLDITKNVFHFIGCNQAGKIVKNKMLKRRDVLAIFLNYRLALLQWKHVQVRIIGHALFV